MTKEELRLLSDPEARHKRVVELMLSTSGSGYDRVLPRNLDLAMACHGLGQVMATFGTHSEQATVFAKELLICIYLLGRDDEAKEWQIPDAFKGD